MQCSLKQALLGVYRGAGRPDGVYYMERLLDQAADELKMPRVDIRRKNLISANQLPFEAISGLRMQIGMASNHVALPRARTGCCADAVLLPISISLVHQHVKWVA